MPLRRFFIIALAATGLLAGGPRGGCGPRPRSYSSPRAYATPKAYAAPKVPSYSAPKHYQTPSLPDHSKLRQPSPTPRLDTPSRPTMAGADGTRYYVGETYKGSGLPKVDRSKGAKREFLRERGLSKPPTGTEIDHIRPLSKGGSDTPGNMQILTREQHREKTAQERKSR